MMRFYGVRFSDLREMPNLHFEALFNAIPALEARESILSISNHTTAISAKKDFEKRIKELYKIARLKVKSTAVNIGEIISRKISGSSK